MADVLKKIAEATDLAVKSSATLCDGGIIGGRLILPSKQHFVNLPLVLLS